jgi:2TM domain
MASNAEFERRIAEDRVDVRSGPSPGPSPEPSTEPSPESSTEVNERSWARKRIEKKQKFRGDVVAYIVVNAFLVGIWAIGGRGYFWPGWVLAGWGVGLVLDAWNLYFRQPITDADIDQELRRRNK